MLQKIIFAVFLWLLLTLFTTCRKYPENILWIRSPRYALSNVLSLAKVTEYKVNGIDSMSILSKYLPGINSDDPYFHEIVGDGYELIEDILRYKDWYMADINLNGYKKIRFDCSIQQIDTLYRFFSSYKSEWDILKLNLKELHIKRTYNNKVYEIKFQKVKK